MLRVFVQSTAACTLAMVSGNVALISLSHLMIAARVGTVVSLIFLGLMFASKTFFQNKWLVAGFVFVVTAVVDYNTHPASFEGEYTEAIVTGLIAATFTLIYSFLPLEKKLFKEGVARRDDKDPRTML